MAQEYKPGEIVPQSGVYTITQLGGSQSSLASVVSWL
jgi:hypothetical protein